MVSENLVSEKNYRFWFQRFGLGRKVLVSVSENLVSKESRSFGKFGIGKKVSVSSSIKILVSLFSAWRCPTSRRVDRSPESAQS